MTCDLPSLRLTEHHEGVLSSDDCAAVERHLAECATCGELRRDLEDLVRLCRQAGGQKVTMPEELRVRIASMLASAEDPSVPARGTSPAAGAPAGS